MDALWRAPTLRPKIPRSPMPTSQDEFYRGLERAGAALSRARGGPAERAAAVHDAIADLLRDTDAHERLACRSGCAHCCHFPVGVTFAEAVQIADAIRADDALRERVLADADATGDAAWHQLVGRACPLLRDGACQRYPQRPMPCRALGSLDEAACSASLTANADVPRDEAAWWRGLGAAQALDEGHGRRELRSAVAALLRAARGEQAAAFARSRAVPQP